MLLKIKFTITYRKSTMTEYPIYSKYINYKKHQTINQFCNKKRGFTLTIFTQFMFDKTTTEGTINAKCTYINKIFIFYERKLRVNKKASDFILFHVYIDISFYNSTTYYRKYK